MRVYYKNTNVDGNKPAASEMTYGELAVNYNTTNPRLMTKDSQNTIVSFLPESKVNSMFTAVNNQLTQAGIDVALNTTDIENLEAWINVPITDGEIENLMGGGNKPLIPELLDIVYYDGSLLKTIHPSQYNTNLGTAVGVIVIPSGMLPDGKARFVALQNADSSKVKWGSNGDTSLTNYTKVPTTDNAGSTTNSSNRSGFLPSDDTLFTGEISYVDPKTKYGGRTPYIPSPYLQDGSLNPAYCETISGYNNALSDFNGKSNTDVLGIYYTAANAAKNYTVDGIDIDWYLPAAGELSFLMPRFAAINKSIAIAGGVALPWDYFWSSTEYDSKNAYCIYTNLSYMGSENKATSYFYVRSFAML